MTVNLYDARVSVLCTDDKHGTWLAVGEARDVVEIRVTKSGLIRVGKPQGRTKARAWLYNEYPTPTAAVPEPTVTEKEE